MDYRQLFGIGDRVEVATDRDFTTVMFGEIISVGGQAVNVRYMTDTEFGVLRFCWHADDPRMQELGKFEANISRNTNDTTGEVRTGVFRLARSQRIINEFADKIREIHDRLVSQDGTMERLLRRIVTLENRSTEHVGKRRGRPPKDREAEALAATATE